jgi:cytochrome P450
VAIEEGEMRSEQILFPMIRAVGARPRLAQFLLGRDRWGNPMAPEVIADPYSTVPLSMADGPVVHRALYQQWFIQGYDELREVLARDDVMASAQIDTMLDIRPYTRLSERSRFFLRHLLPVTDPPIHPRLRSLVSRAFTPRRVAELEPSVERLTAQLLDALPRRGPIDVRNGFTVPLPINVIAHMLGVPEAAWPDVQEMTGRIVRLLDPLMTFDPADVDEAVDALHDLYLPLVEQRRADPTDDLLTALVEAETDGDRLTRDELMVMVITLMGAGFETTSGLLGCSILHLADHPDQRELVRADPGLWPNAVEELLRFDSPVKVGARRTTTEIELAGQRIPAGANLLLSYLNAHRDETRWDDPYRLRLDRPDPRPLAFGHGVHHCLGAALARMEARIGLRAFLDRYGDYTVDEVEWRLSMTMRNQTRLVIRA